MVLRKPPVETIKLPVVIFSFVHIYKYMMFLNTTLDCRYILATLLISTISVLSLFLCVNVKCKIHLICVITPLLFMFTAYVSVTTLRGLPTEFIHQGVHRTWPAEGDRA